jgi:hypothetical protein
MCRFEGGGEHRGLLSGRTNFPAFSWKYKRKARTYQLCHLDETWTGCFYMARQPLVGKGLLIIEASRSHSDTPHSVELLWTSDQPDAGTSTWQNATLTTDRYPCSWRDSNPQSQKESSRRPMPIEHDTSRKKCRSIITLPRYTFICLLVIWPVCYWLMLYHRGPLIFQKSGSHLKILGARKVSRTTVCRGTHKC